MSKNRFNKSIEILKQLDDTKIPDTNINIIEDEKSEVNKVINDTKDTKLNSMLDSILFNEPTGSNCTFYLSYEVSEAINRVSREKKISKSKLVDKILKQVLIEEY